MRLQSPSSWWQMLAALGLLWLGTADAEPPATVAPSALQACARLTADAERLACYDRLAGRGAGPASTPAPAPAATVSAAPAGGVASAAAAAPAAPPSTSFGSYAAEHPTPPPVANSLEAPIAALGKSASGHTTLSLEGGAVWELDAPDPLLRVGDVVTITRAALGSYILYTPSKRAHRARRLQ